MEAAGQQHGYDDLPFIGAARRDVKHAIVAVLSKTWPLKAKQVYRLVEKGEREITYQGVHKALKQLVAEGAVSETPEGYELSMQWVQMLREALSKISNEYSGKGNVRLGTLNKAKISLKPFAVLEALLATKQLVWEPDNFFLVGNRVHIISSPFMVYLGKILHEEGRDWLMYHIARRKIPGWLSSAQKKTGIDIRSISEVSAHGGDMFAFMGWGSVDIMQMETTPPKITLVMESSPVAREFIKHYGKTNCPVDDFVRGVFAGTYQGPFQEPTLEFVETKCLAMGDSHCEFLGMPRASFNLKDKNILRQIGSEADVKNMEKLLARRQ
jgi:predicted hydrocarbon binding protein